MRMKLLVLAAAALMGTPALAQDCGPEQRLYESRLIVGEAVCIPAAPERIAFIERENVIAYLLGQPLIVIDNNVENLLRIYPNAPRDQLAGAVETGWAGELDLERLLLADPDLIVSEDWYTDIKTPMEMMAPVIEFRELPGATWRDLSYAVADLLGKRSEIEAQFAALDERIADLGSRLPAEPPTVSMVLFRNNELSVWTSENYALGMLLDAGFEMGPGIRSPEEGKGLYTLSPELIAQIDADWIVVAYPGGENDDAFEEFAAGPIWQSLSAVKSGHVIRTSVTLGHWTRNNVAFAHRVLDDVYAALFDMAPDEGPHPNPYASWLAAE